MRNIKISIKSKRFYFVSPLNHIYIVSSFSCTQEMLKKKILRPFTSKYISFKRDGISRWLRWPANLWNISLEKKKKERKKVTQSSLRNIFHLRWNVATKRVPSERERFLRGSYVQQRSTQQKNLSDVLRRDRNAGGGVVTDCDRFTLVADSRYI